jgi:hypothetical protein
MNKLIFLPLCLLAATGAAHGDGLRSATVTKAINSVQVYPTATTAHPAATGEVVAAPSLVQTGRQSRAELTFPDLTITRLGQNSAFNLRAEGRDIELKQGTVLLQVPKNSGGATIRTATVTAAITGTTLMFEYSPEKWIKLLTLEGTQQLFIKGIKEPIAIPAGKMLMMHPDAKVAPALIEVDIEKILKTSPLAGDDFFGPLPAAALKAIEATIERQKQAKRDGNLLPTNQVITGSGQRQAAAISDSKALDAVPGPIEPQTPL